MAKACHVFAAEPSLKSDSSQPSYSVADLGGHAAGLADACRLAGRTKEAQDAYGVAIKLNPHGELADKARAGSNLLAQSGFDRIRKIAPRQDAVRYCLDALQRCKNMLSAELKKLCLELAMAGRGGFCDP